MPRGAHSELDLTGITLTTTPLFFFSLIEVKFTQH